MDALLDEDFVSPDPVRQVIDGSSSCGGDGDWWHHRGGGADGSDHGFGFVEVVPSEDLIDQVMFERNRVGDRFSEVLAVAGGEEFGGILSVGETGDTELDVGQGAPEVCP